MKIWHNHSLNALHNVISSVRKEMEPDEFFHVATHLSADSPIQLSADDFFQEYDWKRQSVMPDGYLYWALKFCCENSIDVFIPYLYREDLSEHSEDFSSIGVRLLVAGSPENMNMLENKPAFLERIGRLGIKGTPFVPYCDRAGFDAAWEQMSTEYDRICVKPAKSIYSAGFTILGEDFNDLHNMMNAMRHKLSLDLYRSLLSSSKEHREMMMMPYLQGVERSVDFACLDGELLASVTRRKSGRAQIVEHDDFHHDIAARIVKEFNLSGVLNLQTIEGDDGTPYVLEVNSRTAGGVFKGLHSGINLPLILLRKLAGKDIGSDLRATTCRVGDVSGSVLLP